MTKKMSSSERKQQFIQAAFELFSKKGYENTSIQDILDKVQISRGAFYYYFNSKEDLIEEISKNLIEKIIKIPRKIAARNDLSAVEKLNEYFRKVISYKESQLEKIMPLFKKMYADNKNIKLQNKMYDHAEKLLKPIIKSIIDQGIEEGNFHISYPDEAPDFYCKIFFIYGKNIGETFFDSLNDDEKFQKLIKKYNFLQNVIENTFGLDQGSLILGQLAEKSLKKIRKNYSKLNSNNNENFFDDYDK